MSIANTIAGQLHHTKPDAFEPGRDVGMIPLNNDNALGILVNPADRIVVINYDAGADEYDVAALDAPPIRTLQSVERLMGVLLAAILSNDSSEIEVLRGLGCEQIGEYVWGEQAKPFTLPMVMMKFGDDDWEVIA